MPNFTPFFLLSTVAATGNFINGNWYANSIERLAYYGVGAAGSYQRITNMDSATGACAKEPQPFGGPMAPFDEDVSSSPMLLDLFQSFGLDRFLIVKTQWCLVKLTHPLIYFAPGLGD
jgi:hypothetical protein